MSDNRFASISDILNRSPVAAETPQSTPKQQHPVSGQRTSATDAPGGREPGTRQKRGRTETPVRKSESSTGGVRRVALRLDPQLHKALTAKVAADRTSQGEAVLDAVEDVHQQGRLADLIQKEQNSANPPGGLFPRLRPRGSPVATIPVELRMDARAVDVLDKLAKDLGAESRTQLIALALRNHLSQHN